MISLVRKSLQLELYSFMQVASTQSLSVTNSAFNQSRMKIKPELFKHFISFLNDQFYTDNDERVKLWNGFRLLSADGSTLALPITSELKKIYEYNINQYTTDVLIGRTSIIFDLENEMILDGVLSPIKNGERKLAINQLKTLGKSSFNDLIILDRGYPSFDMIYELQKMNIDFVMRVKQDFSNVIKSFSESDETDRLAIIKPSKKSTFFNKLNKKNKPQTVRLIKVKLNNNQTEILISSLKKEQFGIEIFKELYFKRWGIETMFDKLKNKLLIEQFSGYSHRSILQDFYCTLFLCNIQSLLTSEANETLKESNKKKKYEYKINTNLSIGFLKTKIVELFLEENQTKNTLQELEKLFVKNLIPIRPNRSFNRDPLKYRKRKKPPITKNYKSTL